MRIATASLVKSPIDRLTEWVAYHLNVGIDEMHLFFDDPDDPGIAALRDHPRVHCYPCDEAFWSARPVPGATQPPVVVEDKQHAALYFLMNGPELRADWLAHIDSDELIWAPGDVRAALERECGRAGVHLQLPPLEAVPPDLKMTDAFREVHLFKEQHANRVDLAKRLGARAPFRGGVYLRGHRKGKALVRVGAFTSMRAHGPTPSQLRAAEVRTTVSRKVRILHYDAGTFAEWRAKWGNRSAYRGGSRARRRQTERFDRIVARPRKRRRERGLRRLYRREYMLTGRDARILRAVGLLHRIEVDPDLFTMPTT